MKTWLFIVTLLLTGLARPAAVCAQGAGAAPDSPPAAETPATAQDDSLNVWNTGVSPTVAVLMSPVFPGWGQLYARQSWRAALAFGAEMFFWTNLVMRDQRARRDHAFAANFSEGSPNHEYYLAVGEEDWKQMRDFAWWSGGALLILALDAYVGAHLFNFDSDPMPVPDDWDDVFGDTGTNPFGGGGGPQVTLLQWRTTF